MSQVWANYQDEARYHRLGELDVPMGEMKWRPGLQIAPSVMENAQPLVPVDYGNWNLLNLDAAGGLSASTTDMARIVAGLNVPAPGSAILTRASVRDMLQRATDQYAIAIAESAPDQRAGYGFDSMSAVGNSFSGYKGGWISSSQDELRLELDGVSLFTCINATSS